MRGSRKIFTFGVQTERAWKRVTSPPFCCSSFHLARISSDVASKTLYTIPSLNDAAIPIGSGKTVTSPNIEYLLHLKRPEGTEVPDSLTVKVEDVVAQAHGALDKPAEK